MTGAAIAAQVAAATPDRSSWVAANAGSGKTRVLTDRVARLLLDGCAPQKILCLTYTKAAAAEMQTRLFRTLGGWAMLDDAPLQAALRALGAADAADLDRARTLFARALETPGGLKIQTIHAFCEALLRRFPLEAGVAPQFQVLEDRQARALREAVLDALATRAPRTVAELAAHLSGDDPDPVLREIGHHRAAFAAPFDPDALARTLGIDRTLSVERLDAATLLADDRAFLAALVPLLEASGPQDRGTAADLAAALAAGDADRRLAHLEDALLTGGAAAVPYGAKLGRLPTKAIRAANPELCARLDELMTRVEAARPRRLAIAALAKSSVLHRFARTWLAALDARKAALGVLDFDDMIARTGRLLADPAASAWVLWRLDGGIDHILVDEAQDTSPAQWQVVRALSAEFFAGRSAREIVRTVFVVGDEKQSIYSFQGADPAAFGDMRRHFAAMLDGMGSELQGCELIHSFRSAGPILRLVDTVFAGPAGDGLDTGVAHAPIDPDAPGRVELWPYLPKPDKPDESPWDQPLDMPAADDPVEVLARRIAATVAGWLTAGRVLPGAAPPRAIAAGDVMILVQSRSQLFDALIRALKVARVPVAGADVLRIGGELAVQDLLAVLRFAATPADDLSLAAVLRSPLGGLSESALFALAHARRGTLWEALRAVPAGRWPDVRAMLADTLGQGDFLRPFELLQRILIRHDGRRRLVARLGTEAEDGVDALLDQALGYERAEAPTLGGFLAWIDRDAVTVKRRSEASAGQVRVMTVHGAKGLESPIVILPDTGERQEARNPPEILRAGDGTALWRLKKDDAPPAIAAAEQARRDRARAENMRLLYVALTRAARWLIVAGAGGVPRPDGDSWHALVAAAMDALPATTLAGPDGPVRVLETNWSAAPATGAPGAGAAPPVLPDWARRPVTRRGTATPALLSPSGLGGAHSLPGGPDDDDPDVRARGAGLHLLLETLPGHPRADWPALADRLLPGAAADLLPEAARVLEAPGLAAVFGPDSRAEIDVTAALPALGGARMLGRIDRLIVAPDRVTAVDFKSNRLVPAGPDAVPEGILRQMGAYRAALSAIWPDRRATTAILWTAEPRLMTLPDALVDAALSRAALLDRSRAAS